MGRVKCDHIKQQTTLTSDNIKRLSLYLNISLQYHLNIVRVYKEPRDEVIKPGWRERDRKFGN